jgi:hypothetical protein
METVDDALKWAQELIKPGDFNYRNGYDRVDIYYSVDPVAGKYLATYWPRDERYTYTGTFDECKQWLIAMIAANI